jgi:hypothetical protein
MNLRFVPFALALLSLTGCKEIIQKLAKKSDAGAATVASADPSPAPASDDDDAPPPSPTGTPTAKATAKSTAGKTPTAAAASPAELEKAFAALDINDDNQLDGIEVKNCGCAIADANADGEITKAEYLAAGLLGKFKPGVSGAATARTVPTNAPTGNPTNAPTPTQPTPPPPPPPPAAGGLPPGDYRCAGLIGGVLSTTGTLRIIDGSRYSAQDGSGAGNYTFDPATKVITFPSGMYSKPDTVKSARQISDRQIRLQLGKSGFTTSDCKR